MEGKLQWRSHEEWGVVGLYKHSLRTKGFKTMTTEQAEQRVLMEEGDVFLGTVHHFHVFLLFPHNQLLEPGK